MIKLSPLVKPWGHLAANGGMPLRAHTPTPTSPPKLQSPSALAIGLHTSPQQGYGFRGMPPELLIGCRWGDVAVSGLPPK